MPVLSEQQNCSVVLHTYKFGEAVEDEVVLDLVYEARDIPQELGSSQKGGCLVRGQDERSERLAEGRIA